MFENFDPLNLSDGSLPDESVRLKRQKRSIHSILHSYVGWYDPFAELIQNALDSVEKKEEQQKKLEKKYSLLLMKSKIAAR